MRNIVKHFYPIDEIVSISEDKTVIELRYTEEEHSVFDPREQKENYKVYENTGVRTLELRRDLYTSYSYLVIEAYVENK